MAHITAAGTYNSTTPGFEFLAGSREERTLLFAGSALPTTLEIKYTDDEGVDYVLQDGTITSLPASIVIGPVNRPLKLVATGGSPDFSVCGA